MSGIDEPPDRQSVARQHVMGTLARASQAEVVEAVARLGDLPDFEDIRQPEVGLVMLRGRMAGTGAPFNLGEATVTRAAVRLSTGQTGFSYILGRDRAKARLAAFVDALWAVSARRPEVEARIVLPLAERQAERDRLDAARTAATRVDFFTMVRGEDPA